MSNTTNAGFGLSVSLNTPELTPEQATIVKTCLGDAVQRVVADFEEFVGRPELSAERCVKRAQAFLSEYVVRGQSS